MQCYDDDDIFIFGFSRGAYVARFLAEMLDHVGLLSAGNQEMARFAWKAFAQWQEREENTAEEKEKKKELLRFLKAFRNTFSRPVRRIRFLGLFDTGNRTESMDVTIAAKGLIVNSVPRFESAWMKRSKFPYTARSSAKVIRHAVSIDERRAKFRSDLLSETRTSKPHEQCLRHRRGQETGPNDNWMTRGEKPNAQNRDRFRRKHRTSNLPRQHSSERSRLDPRGSNSDRLRSPSPAVSRDPTADACSIRSGTSMASFQPTVHLDDDEADKDEAAAQDIEELWFPGCHADLGGGWPLDTKAGEESPLSHGPLVWMVREAQRAGLEFDAEQMLEYKCCDQDYNIPSLGFTTNRQPRSDMPKIRVTTSPGGQDSPETASSPHDEKPEQPASSEFHKHLTDAFTKGTLHDCLQFNNGLTVASVLSWKIMEYLPFRRMDLRPDGSWKAISLPLFVSFPPHCCSFHTEIIS